MPLIGTNYTLLNLISPVFDFSTKALIIYVEQGKEKDRHEICNAPH
jgi:hypothetical protein